MKKKIWISIGVVVLILVLVGVNVFRTMGKENPTVETAKVEEREITGNVMVPGTLSLKQEEFLYLEPENGEVSEVLVKEGDQVEVGTPLLRYENKQLQLEKEQNALSLESANLRINQIKDQITALEDKEKDLKDQVGKKEAEETVEAERKQLNTDLKVANLEARQVQLQKETIEEQQGQLEVKSEIVGTVLSIDEDALAGRAQTPILHIGKADEFVVKATISEYDSLKIKEEQPVILKSDVILDKEWKGTVSKVSLLPVQTENVMGNEDTAVQYPLEVTLDNQDIEAKPGFKLIMDIETEKRKVQAIPVEAVKQDGENYYVFVVEEGQAIRKDVKLGATSDKFMELTSGVKNGQKVIINPPDSLQNGMEVSVK
jgi:HlyD family secretion protein